MPGFAVTILLILVLVFIVILRWEDRDRRLPPE
jgi:hypothetical protein